MTRPKLLDLFSGAGGAAMGYHLAGFDVVGVDNRPQPRYPFTFVQADAMTFPLDGYDAVHASPPCRDHSALVSRVGRVGTGWMLGATRQRLVASGLPYVIENVEGAVMPGAITLCGSEFGLTAVEPDGRRWLKRHRKFESNMLLMGAGGCNCAGRPVGGVYGTGGGGQMTRGWKFRPHHAREAMGIDWMNRAELTQAIPPAYTAFIGEQLISALALEEAK